MIEQTIKENIKLAMKEKNAVIRDIMRLAIGEFQREQNNSKNAGKELSEEEKIAIIKKLLKNNKETLFHLLSTPLGYSDDEFNLRKFSLGAEIAALENLLPKTASKEEIMEFVSKIDLSQAKSEGQAIGLVMKEVKKANLNADNEMIRTCAVELILKNKAQ